MHTLTLSRATPRSGTPSRAEGRLRATLMAASLAALTVALPPLAGAAHAETKAPSTLAMLEAMVAAGVLTQEKAQDILTDAKARDAARAEVETPPPLSAGAKRVTYVPEIVKQELREEIKQEVMAKARDEGWAAPNEVPEWTQRIKFSGDVRARAEGLHYPDGNIPGLLDFNSMNSGGPTKIYGPGTAFSGVPYLSDYATLNTDQNRNRARIRARLGVDADLGDGMSTGMRIATGSGSAPVSTNQTLGGSGGNFSKYQLWLDRAYIKWDAIRKPDLGLTVDVGRFDNPFFSTDLVWDGDLGFDGVAVSGRYEAAKGVTPFLTAGAFPVFNTDLDFSTNSDRKQASEDKWLYGVQAGTDWRPSRDVGFKFGGGYFHYTNIEGERSAPCDIRDPDDVSQTSSSVACSTDLSRPTFAQKGNTYMALRDLSGTPYGNGVLSNTAPGYQYYGLATPFRELTLTGRVDYDGFDDVRLTLDGEFVKNLAFEEGKVAALAVNNNETGVYDGGDTGYMLRLTLGSPDLADRWDWQTSLAYKYVESDAVVDGMTDSDFGMGGTNLEGFVLGGDLALAKNVSTSFRWMSADSIGGASYSVDTLQADLTARF